MRSSTEIKLLRIRQTLTDQIQSMADGKVVNLFAYRAAKVRLAVCEELLKECRIRRNRNPRIQGVSECLEPA